MEQLLEMRNIPIKFEFRVQNARHEIKNLPSSFEIQRDRGTFEISNKRGQVLLDTTDARASIGLKTLPEAVRENRDRAIQAAYEATANYVEEGNMMVTGKDVIPQIGAQRIQPVFESALGFLPSSPVNIQWDPPDFSMRYEMDKLNFEWRTNHEPDVQFIPGGLEYSVTQYPKVEITYLGKPIYVPPSSSPDYEPSTFDVKA